MSENERPDDELLVPAVGALVFASDEPVEPRELARVLGVTPSEVTTALDALAERLERAGCGLALEHVAGGARLVTRPELATWLRRLFRERNRSRLSPPALETLAIVAYRQPVTLPEIQAIRGKDPTAAIRGLLEKKLVRILGRKRVVGNPLLYGTSKAFLVHFGLDSLADLPSIEDFDRFIEVLDARSALAAGEPLPFDEGTPDVELAFDEGDDGEAGRVEVGGDA
jgi:segregation and condensation protein B